MAKRQNTNTTVLAFTQIQIEQLRNSNRLGTAINYQKTMHNFAQFLNGKDIPFKSFTEHLINSYNVYLQQRGMVRNSSSFYLRIMRAIYNKAIKQKLTKQTYPFADVYTGVDRTRKRAVSQTVIASLYKLTFPQSSSLAFSRDLFIFSYCTRGMSFVDMAYLKKTNLQDGYIIYSRQKTGQQLSIKIEPLVGQIISKYHTSDIPFLFPIITSQDSHIAYRQYQHALNTYNRHLRIIAKMFPGEIKLTSYTARHSWATAARNSNIPISVISAGMGHTTEQTTRIYLDSIENSIIDEANKRIITEIAL